MKLRFDANLQYQQQAISAVVDLFSGQTPKQSLFTVQTYSTPVTETQTSMLEQQTVPVLSMHAPYEVTSKYDLYEAYRGYKAFWEKN